MRAKTKKSLPKAQKGIGKIISSGAKSAASKLLKGRMIDSQPVPSKYQKKMQTPTNPSTLVGKKGGAMKKMQKGGRTTYSDISGYGKGIVETKPRVFGKGTKEKEVSYGYGYAGPSGAAITKTKYDKKGLIKKQKTKETTPAEVDKYVAKNESKIEYKKGGVKKMQSGGPTSTNNKAPERKVLPQIAAAIGAGAISGGLALREDIKKANARRKAKKAEKKENKKVDTATPKQQYGGTRKSSAGMKSMFGGKRKISKSCKSGNCTPMRG